MKSIVAETASQFSYCTFAGAGGSGGLRYFFGENGISGFYVGALLLYLHYTVQPSTSSYGTGNHEYSFFVGAAEAGYRFLIGDIFTITLGLASGYALNSTATGTIAFNPVTTGGLAPWDHYSAAMHNFYFEITVGLGIAF
jgi:hypothetical protein